jgi:hypothetical protein
MCSKSKCKYRNYQNVGLSKRYHTSLVFMVICVLLVIGGIEQHPGPDNVELIKAEIQKSNESLIAQLTSTIVASKSETIKAVTEVNVKVDNIIVLLESVKSQLSNLSKANERISSLESCKVDLLEKKKLMIWRTS